MGLDNTGFKNGLNEADHHVRAKERYWLRVRNALDQLCPKNKRNN